MRVDAPISARAKLRDVRRPRWGLCQGMADSPALKRRAGCAQQRTIIVGCKSRPRQWRSGLVSEPNCVAVRRGGEQGEENRQPVGVRT